MIKCKLAVETGGSLSGLVGEGGVVPGWHLGGVQNGAGRPREASQQEGTAPDAHLAPSTCAWAGRTGWMDPSFWEL